MKTEYCHIYCQHRRIYTNLTNSVEQIPWEAVIVAEEVNKFPLSYITRCFISILSRACHWSLCWTKWIHYIYLHPVPLRLFLILSSIYAQVFEMVSSFQVFWLKLRTFFTCTTRWNSEYLSVTMILQRIAGTDGVSLPGVVSSNPAGGSVFVHFLVCCFVWKKHCNEQTSHPYRQDLMHRNESSVGIS